MKNSINYSFIIPHHNSPDLLKRCVDSIPHREDVEIIIVDDNSAAEKKAIIRRPDVTIFYIDKNNTKGAGHARNIGLSHAKGKWLLFADADDYYTPGFLNVLDKYNDGTFDVLYFNALYQTPEGKEMKGGSRLNHIIEAYDGSIVSSDLVRYRVHAPWNKMICRSFIEAHGFCFEEVPNGNDTMFTYQVGYFAKEIKVIAEKLYVYTINPNSITHRKHSSALFLSVLANMRKNIVFYNYVGHPEWGKEISLKIALKKMVKRLRIVDAVHMISIYMRYREYIKVSENIYVDLIKKIEKEHGLVEQNS